MEFTKLHGCGNSFVLIDDRRRRIRRGGALARELCSSATGIGADGLILVRAAAAADVRMDYFNADGSTAEMCGNGVRCLAAFVRERGIVRRDTIRVETLKRTVETRILDRSGGETQVRVDMGQPALHSPDLSVRRSSALDLPIGGRRYAFVSMGNPHAVTFVDDFEFNVAAVGRRVETTSRLFPHKVNVGFAVVESPRALRLKVWERGCGLTQACGSGACAAVIAGTLLGRVDRRTIRVRVDGGTLEILWDERSGSVFMTGPAVEIAHGTVRPPSTTR